MDQTAQQTQKFRREVFDWVEIVAFSIVAVVFLLTFLFRIVGIEGGSMENTLHEGERVMVSGLFYTPDNGDIIVITQPNFSNKPLIKRVIAVGNQTIDIDYETGTVYLDGQPIEEPYLGSGTFLQGDTPLPLTVPEGKVFVMGDNRMRSTDSRDSLVGLIDERYILGKVIFRISPLNKIGVVH
ncbi:signal peptidase I [Feifania hominis]|uniref:Signal peptidase I n=1 Tax=Feifania hominis TaxID=2763660 RepID=A0A926HTS6_9FIRM|nr:signal peptidase I [Feifania hominis]MBC8535608.1 signal peptidase I [Feifania hominis]